MSPEELENWQKIKESLEEQGATDNNFYKRAVIIVGGGKDPLELPSLEEEE